MIYILRGLPGSGKSTLARQYPDATVCSADHYHMVDGVYRYDVKNAAAAHNACFQKFLKCVGYEMVIVDNTNISAHELAPYVAVAKAYDVPWEIILVNSDLATCLGRNTHNVPDNTMLDMQRRLITEFIPWPQRIV